MNILNKLKNFIKSIFHPQKKLIAGSASQNNTTNIDNYIDSLQKDYQNSLNKTEILNEIDKNPFLIDTLSYKRLKQLNQLYDERINELEIKLKMLKNN